MTYWINTVGADHVQRGVAGGFTQANHGKPDMLRKMARDDWIIFYSPKPHSRTGNRCRRRNMEFLPCTATPIRPLLSRLQFIADPQRWGYKFRFGVFRIDEADFELIRSVMTQPLAA
jgi:EVE domain